MNSFAEMSKINVNDKIEKKGKLSYLSWVWAISELMKADPEAFWDYREPVTFADGSMMVFCTVTAFGKPKTMQLPVMDYKNKAIPSPNAFDVNTAMQRCLVKAIALHGLGLYIYAGEDLPPSDSEEKDWEKWMADNAIPVQDALNAGNVSEGRDKYEEALNQLPDENAQKSFHFLFNASDRATLKTEGKRRREEQAEELAKAAEND